MLSIGRLILASTLLIHIVALIYAQPVSIHTTRADAQETVGSGQDLSKLTELLKSSDEEKRLNAVLQLSSLRDAGAVSILKSAIDDKSELVRAAALNGVALYGDSENASTIIPRLATDKSSFVRKMAAYALGRLRTPSSLAALTLALGDKDGEVRGAAVVAISDYRDPSTITALINAFQDTSSFVREKAAHALGLLGSAAKPAVPALIRLLGSTESSSVQLEAAIALGEIGDRSALPALERAKTLPDPHLSKAAIDAINKLTR
jgi:HEAT repeat protein